MLNCMIYSARPVVSSFMLFAACALVISGCGRSYSAQSATDKQQATEEVAVVEEEPSTVIVEPTYLDLPYVVDDETTAEELSSMALQVALSEEARGEISVADIPTRQQAILDAWLLEYEKLKATIAAVKAKQAARHEYELAELRRSSEMKREREAMQVAWDKELRREKMRVLPLLSEEDQAILLREHREVELQRSREANNLP